MATILEKTNGIAGFVRAVDCKSFSGAARLLGTSPSAVSKSVARLEKRLGVKLLQRSTRHLAMTTEGAGYYERVRPLLQAIEDAADAVQRADAAHGILRVTAGADLGRGLVAAWVRDFAAHHPHLKLELSITDRPVNLVREGFDVAVRMGELADSGLLGRALGELEMVLVASPDYFRRHSTPRTLKDLERHPALRRLKGGKPAPFYFADGTTLLPEGPLDSDDPDALRHAAANGAGIAALLRMAVEDDLAHRRLVQVLPDTPLRRMPAHVLHAFENQVPVRARLFIDFLAARMGQQGG
jgi:DNA-binding transcriptional LysR family regulator